MGSTGTGNFTDYSGTPKSGGNGQGGSSQGSSGGGNDQCTRSFSVQLEDVEHCDYFAANSAPPPVGTELRIELKKRVVAVAAKDGSVVGNIPTTHNYLATCIKAGFNYAGIVQLSKNAPPIVTVSADFAPV